VSLPFSVMRSSGVRGKSTEGAVWAVTQGHVEVVAGLEGVREFHYEWVVGLF
jgi:hypothetical protein